jgi:hypothetical protein
MTKASTTKATTATEINTTEVDPIRTLKTASCASLSDRSTLTYKIGFNPEGVIQFRVCGNTGSGFYNDEWVSLQDVQDVVDGVPDGIAITSSTFRSIYAGKSNNSSGFLLAVMKHLGLATSHTGSQRGYVFLDTVDFIAEMGVLIAELPPLEVVKKSTLHLKAKAKKAQAESMVATNDALEDAMVFAPETGVDGLADVANA